MAVRQHVAIQAFNLGFVPLVMLGVCSALGGLGLLPAALADGLLVMAAVPTTVNMCVALTRRAGWQAASSPAPFRSAPGCRTSARLACAATGPFRQGCPRG